MIQDLKDKYKNETVWIVGKGPSLQYLKKEDIGPGPVIAINQAIISVEDLGIANPIYSMQKDGGPKRRPTADNQSPVCDHSPHCGDQCGDMVRPKSAVLLVHKHESMFCFPDYAPRYVFDWADFDLPGNVFSLIIAVKIAQLMGCAKFRFIACDAHVGGSMVNLFIPHKGLSTIPDKDDLTYEEQVEKFKPFLMGLDFEFITPGKIYPKIQFGCLINDLMRLRIVLMQSELSGFPCHYVQNPKSAASGLNQLLELLESKGAEVGVLAHQDMYYRSGFIPQLEKQLALLPDSWIVAGIIGKDMNGAICGKLQDHRMPLLFDTSEDHEFPHPASCFDECCIIVNLKKKFRFNENLEGFDLYGTMCVLQAWEMNGTAWIIDDFADHYCMRSFDWVPDEKFEKSWQWLHERFPDAPCIFSTAMGGPDLRSMHSI